MATDYKGEISEGQWGCAGKIVAILYPPGYDWLVIEIFISDIFASWFDRLKDRQARARIQARIDRAALGNFGDAAPVGDGISEMRVHYGPGYRVYFMRRGSSLVVLLSGGDKSSQSDDIRKAKLIAADWKEHS